VITMKQLGPPGSPNVEFDAYVPLTATWDSASGLLDPPRYAALRDGNGYLELKFHPETGVLTEVVLAAAPGIQVDREDLGPRNQGPYGLMPYLGPGDDFPAPGDQLVIRAHPDYLYVSFGREPGQWAGTGPVLFGIAEDQTLTAIAVRWTPAERETVLGR
jgi:hypothetical protein